MEMLSGRRKRDYEADSLAAQVAGDTTTASPAQASNAADADRADETDQTDEADEESPVDDEQVLVLA
ncbi:MAG: hypothetical protein ABSG37_11710 [Candidatus Limnocylindrales bacterium]